MAPSTLILLANGTEETEFVTTYDILVRAGFEVQSCGIDLDKEYATCTRNVRILPDTTTLPKEPATTILILPGGAPGAKTFATNPAVQSLIRAYREDGRWTAFICAATTALTASVVSASSSSDSNGARSARKCRVTSHPSFKEEVVKAGWEYADDSERVVVVESQKVITSRGPGTAMEFALTIVECLMGKEKRDEITGPLVMMPANL